LILRKGMATVPFCNLARRKHADVMVIGSIINSNDP